MTALGIPVLNRLMFAIPSPSVGMTRRMMARGAGRQAVERATREFWEVRHWAMRMPGYATALISHVQSATRLGRPCPENFLSDDELRRIEAPTLFVWGDKDAFGSPEICRRALELMPERGSRSSTAATCRGSTTPTAAGRSSPRSSPTMPPDGQLRASATFGGERRPALLGRQPPVVLLAHRVDRRPARRRRNPSRGSRRRRNPVRHVSTSPAGCSRLKSSLATIRPGAGGASPPRSARRGLRRRAAATKPPSAGRT